ncbi:DUF547 domain-containing protein [Fulvivirga sp. 29W222]|uniref:DUF547 domain-containing protein n=1 Tax=Fulvivirga marina TaxID=2494733 RepID=A0A937FXV9_9BACT|nr:DUF547 domain-containing protein [Fulvivirga marina]MBL6447013.1 DUF547 domain-containing protein [Fulvivirga marina]
MKKLVIAILLGIIWAPVANGADSYNFNNFFKQSDDFFKKYVQHGRVAYEAINSQFSEIESLYNSIGDADLSNASDDEVKAFYINAYNLIVIYQVSKYYPLKSPLDQSGFFDKVKHKVAGVPMTLNFLEIKKLILTYKDPRIHFALACAAVSCPPLANFAYMPEQLDQQLNSRTKLSLNDPVWLKVRADQNKVYLSKIFEWYSKDFVMSGEGSVLQFINKYRSKNIPTSYAIAYYEYDWSLNER